MSSRSDAIAISALQHWQFCPRQYGLIHLDQIWEENRFTAEGRLLHENVDQRSSENRSGLRLLRSVELTSARYGLYGVADMVELHGGLPFPVEYKRGKPKAHRADEVQLCAQALCLEEQFGCNLPEGALYYGKTRRRMTVMLDVELRNLTLATIEDIRNCRKHGVVPPPHYEKQRCDNCSLLQQCLPRVLSKKRNIKAWLKAQIQAEDVPE
ncbi:CRISPR-associated protein Cas4 [Polycladidibacter stylochi]|uniref:CRISPR-associated protein Cas4 n=1 Tax=Polycladidibacter stylochi TaxID=1807766 RepID=UPI000833B775|nr:CRISPR-associated protein Cas4 [Pseudovibrio stylochi]